MLILKGFPATLTASFLIDETPFDAGAVTVTVKDAAGNTVSSGAAVAASVGVYSYALAAQSALGALTVTWAGSATLTTLAEVVGNQLISLPDLRASDPAFADVAKYPTVLLGAARDAVTDEFVRITGRSFITRGNTFSVTIDRSGTVLLPDKDIQGVTSAVLDGTALDLTTLSLDPVGIVSGLPTPQSMSLNALWNGSLSTLVPPPGRLTLTYEYGLTPCPADVYRVALIRGRYLLAYSKTGIPDRATSFTAVEGGTFSLATPGMGPWQTGIPEVDSVLSGYVIEGRGVNVA